MNNLHSIKSSNNDEDAMWHWYLNKLGFKFKGYGPPDTLWGEDSVKTIIWLYPKYSGGYAERYWNISQSEIDQIRAEWIDANNNNIREP